jgi:hypothetical protein
LSSNEIFYYLFLLVQMGITPTKFRWSKFPGNMHSYIWCSTQFVSTAPLKLLNRISWNLVGSKDTISSCAYYQEFWSPKFIIAQDLFYISQLLHIFMFFNSVISRIVLSFKFSNILNPTESLVGSRILLVQIWISWFVLVECQ